METNHAMSRGFWTLFFGLMLTTSALAGDQLWIASAVGGTSGKTDSKLKDYASASAEGLNLPILRLIQEKKRDLEPGQENVANFRNGVVVTVKCLTRETTRYTVELTLGDQQGPILKTQVRLAKRSPLIIRGPSTDGGEQLLILEVR